MLSAALKQPELPSVYLSVSFALIFNIIADDFLICIAPDRIDVVTLRPELSSPQELLYLSAVFEYLSRGDAFRNWDNASRGEQGYALY